MSAENYIRLQSVNGLGAKKIRAILNQLASQGKSVNDFFELPASEIQKTFHLSETLVKKIVQSEHPKEIALQVANKGIRVVPYDSAEYPLSLKMLLGNDAPPLLYIWGNAGLLQTPAVGFCGSRDVSPKGIEVTIDTASQIAKKKWAVVSGHARGVDTAAHKSALEAKSGTVIVSPEGILSFKLRAELKAIAKPDQLLIISEFYPTAPWSVGNAMTRNKTLLGLSNTMILIKSRMEGGTFEAGKAALKYEVPLFVAEYQLQPTGAAGNNYFLEQGATVLRKNSKTQKASISLLVRTVNKAKNPVTKREAVIDATKTVKSDLFAINERMLV